MGICVSRKCELITEEYDYALSSTQKHTEAHRAFKKVIPVLSFILLKSVRFVNRQIEIAMETDVEDY